MVAMDIERNADRHQLGPIGRNRKFLTCIAWLVQVLKHVMKVFMFLGENNMDDHHVFHIIGAVFCI